MFGRTADENQSLPGIAMCGRLNPIQDSSCEQHTIGASYHVIRIGNHTIVKESHVQTRFHEHDGFATALSCCHQERNMRPVAGSDHQFRFGQLSQPGSRPGSDGTESAKSAIQRNSDQFHRCLSGQRFRQSQNLIFMSSSVVQQTPDHQHLRAAWKHEFVLLVGGHPDIAVFI